MSETEIRKPIQKRSIETKDKIVEAGFDLICNDGYYNTNTSKIAKKAGVSTGIVYQYFKDKKGILMAGLEKYVNDIFYPMLNASNSTEGAFSLERVKLYSTSISTFFSHFFNFLFGVGYNADSSLIGQHSSLLDTLGRYGLFGGVSWISALIVAKKHIKKFLMPSYRRIFSFIMLAYAVELVLNPVYSDSLILYFFFLAPTFLVLFAPKEKDELRK